MQGLPQYDEHVSRLKKLTAPLGVDAVGLVKLVGVLKDAKQLDELISDLRVAKAVYEFDRQHNRPKARSEKRNRDKKKAEAVLTAAKALRTELCSAKDLLVLEAGQLEAGIPTDLSHLPRDLERLISTTQKRIIRLEQPIEELPGDLNRVRGRHVSPVAYAIGVSLPPIFEKYFKSKATQTEGGMYITFAVNLVRAWGADIEKASAVRELRRLAPNL